MKWVTKRISFTLEGDCDQFCGIALSSDGRQTCEFISSLEGYRDGHISLAFMRTSSTGMIMPRECQLANLQYTYT